MNWQWIDTATGFYVGMVVGMIFTIGAIFLGILFKGDNNG